jgi:hypothetical protein
MKRPFIVPFCMNGWRLWTTKSDNGITPDNNKIDSQKEKDNPAIMTDST